MTEPTHHLRPDVAAQLELYVDRLRKRLALGDVKYAQETLRAQLSDAWHAGWMAGYDDGTEHRRPAPNPYHETVDSGESSGPDTGPSF